MADTLATPDPMRVGCAGVGCTGRGWATSPPAVRRRGAEVVQGGVQEGGEGGEWSKEWSTEWLGCTRRGTASEPTVGDGA